MQRRWYQLSLREIIGALILTAVIGGMYLQALHLKRLEERIEQNHARHAPIYAGLANDSVIYRDVSGKSSYIYCRGCRIEVYETFVLIYGNKSMSHEKLKDGQIIFLPRESVAQLSFQP